MDPDWMDLAECKGLPSDWFFPERTGPDTTDLARAVCAECPVTAECLELSMVGGKQYVEGVYGGFTAGERRLMRRERRADDEHRAAS